MLKDSENLQSWDIGIWEVETKRLLNGVRKCDRQTHKQTDIRTFRLIERIGQEGQFFENISRKIVLCILSDWLVGYALDVMYSEFHPSDIFAKSVISKHRTVKLVKP